MNDIEVLEELGGEYIANKIIERSKNTDIIYLTKDTLLNTNCVKQLAEYLENLLKERQSDKERIKKLEEELEEKDMQHELELIGKEEYTKASMGEIIEQYYTANEDCIPKSLIKEKIEEIKEKIEEAELEKDVTLYSFIFINQIKMRALEELLNTKM